MTMPEEQDEVATLLAACEDVEEYDYSVDACTTCGGEGVEDCEDTGSSEGCWEAGCNGQFHRCPNCRGSGNAEDQRYW